MLVSSKYLTEIDDPNGVQKPPVFDESRKHTKPLNGEVVREMRAYLKDKFEYVKCSVCGDFCPPKEKYGYENMHITCSYTLRGEKSLKVVRKKALQALNKVELF
jgi:hypothetical protein